MSHPSILNIFQTALSGYATAKPIRVAYENVQLTPTANETYLVAHILPSSTKTDTLSGDHKRFMGVFQITIVSPSGKATSNYQTLVNELQTLFPVYKIFEITGFSVQVTSPLHTPEGKVQNGAWVVPCSFEYRADTN